MDWIKITKPFYLLSTEDLSHQQRYTETERERIIQANGNEK